MLPKTERRCTSGTNGTGVRHSCELRSKYELATFISHYRNHQTNPRMDLYKQHHVAEAASMAINNTQNNPARQQQLATFGFGEARFRTGQTLLKNFTQKQAAQTQCQHEQWALSQQLNESLRAVQEQFKQHVSIMQVAFRDDTVLLHSLKVDRFATRRWEGVRQMIHFYDQLRRQKITLDAYGVPAKEIQQAHSAAIHLLQLKEARADKKSCAEHSTQEKQQAQEALRLWVKDFRTTARMAFRDQPQTLEAFGINVRAKV